jgi:hypothetical protein
MNILGAAAFIVIPVAAAVGIAFWKVWKNTSAEMRGRPVQMTLHETDHHHDGHLVGAK